MVGFRSKETKMAIERDKKRKKIMYSPTPITHK